MANEAKITIKLVDDFSTAANTFKSAMDNIHKSIRKTSSQMKSLAEATAQLKNASLGINKGILYISSGKAGQVAYSSQMLQSKSDKIRIQNEILQEKANTQRQKVERESEKANTQRQKVEQEAEKTKQAREKTTREQLKTIQLQNKMLDKANKGGGSFFGRMFDGFRGIQSPYGLMASGYFSLSALTTASNMEIGKIQIDKVIRDGTAPIYYKIAEEFVSSFGISLEEAYEHVARSYKYAPGEGRAREEATRVLTEASLVAKEAFDISAFEASKALAAIMSKFQMPLSQIKMTIAMINDVANALGAVPDKVLLTSLARLPAIKGLDITTAAVILGLARQGTSMEASGVASSSYKVLTKLPLFKYLETLETRDLDKKEIKGLTKETDAFNKVISSSALKYILDNSDEWSKMTQDQQTKFLKKYKITEIREINNARALFDQIAALATNPKNATQIKNVLEVLNKYGTSGLEENFVQQKIAEGDIEYAKLVAAIKNNSGIIFRTYINQLRITIGKIGMKVLEAMGDKTTKQNFDNFISAANDFIDKNQNLVKWLVILTALLSGGAVVLGSIALILMPYVAFFKIIYRTFGLLGVGAKAIPKIPKGLEKAILSVLSGVRYLGKIMGSFGHYMLRIAPMIATLGRFLSAIISGPVGIGIMAATTATGFIMSNLDKIKEFFSVGKSQLSEEQIKMWESATKSQTVQGLINNTQFPSTKFENLQTIDIKVSAEPGTNVESVSVENKQKPTSTPIPSNFNFKGVSFI